MPPPAAPTYQVAEIKMRGIVASQGGSSFKSDNVFHFKRTGIILPWNATNIEAAFQAAIAVPVTNALNVTYTQVANEVRCIDDEFNAETVVSRAVAGAVTGDRMPSFCFAYLLAETGYRGKNWRGNKKFFPLSESSTTAPNADILNAGALTLFAAIATALLAGFTDSDGNVWQYGIFSRALSVVTNPTTINWTRVTSLTMRKSIGRMKKHETVAVY